MSTPARTLTPAEQAARLRRVASRILRIEPDQLDMADLVTVRREEKIPPGALASRREIGRLASENQLSALWLDTEYLARASAEARECGTRGCLAGWTAIEFLEEVPPEPGEATDTYAARVLGLSPRQRANMFFNDTGMWSEAMNSKAATDVRADAVALLEKCAARAEAGEPLTWDERVPREEEDEE